MAAAQRCPACLLRSRGARARRSVHREEWDCGDRCRETRRRPRVPVYWYSITVAARLASAQAAQGEMKYPPPNMPAMPAHWRGVVGEVEKALKSFGDKVRKTDESQLNTTVKFMTGPKQQSDLRRLDVLWFMLNDQIHHRGQLSVYLRMAGGKVPAIYGPSKDEPWH